MTAAAWALISPAGELTWRPLADTPEVEAIVSGDYAPGALDSAFVTGPLRVMASDIALVAPDHYLPTRSQGGSSPPCPAAGSSSRGAGTWPSCNTNKTPRPANGSGRAR